MALFLSKKDFSEQVGLSLPTIDRRLKDGSIRFLRLGGRVLIPQSELDRLAAVAVRSGYSGEELSHDVQ